MIAPARFFDALRARGIDCFAGVPVSLLKNFCAYVTERAVDQHVISAYVGNAVALATSKRTRSARPASRARSRARATEPA